ncbi:MAG: hypothetical protein AMJ92_11395 [candidate division Zixibacteria bacterium SM23_81]|nr:MAG: hypothetical protein AMJ92_11395 [candidate division Zixibacteria bacterium SM23_81]
MTNIIIFEKRKHRHLTPRWLFAVGIFLILFAPASWCQAKINFDGVDDDSWLDFTWTEPENADNALAYYNIYLSIDGTEFSHYDTVYTNTYSVPGVSGHRYKMKVAGVNQYGEEGSHSPESDEILCLPAGSDEIPPQYIDQLAAEESGGAVLLSWPAVTLDSLGLAENLSHYNIYRNEIPLFWPDVTDFIHGVQTTSYLDENSDIGSVDRHSFYLVTAVDLMGNESDISNRVGEYDYTIIPQISGYHMVSLILDDGQIIKAKDLGQDIPNCTAVKEWDPQIQGFASRAFKIDDTWYGETDLQLGYPYYVFVEASPQNVWTMVGGVPADPIFTLYAPGGNGYNTITLPLSNTLTLAKELGQSIPHCTAVKMWDPQTQAYSSIAFKVSGTWYGEAAIRRGQPYFVNVTQDGVWPGGKIVLSDKQGFRKRGQN